MLEGVLLINVKVIVVGRVDIAQLVYPLARTLGRHLSNTHIPLKDHFWSISQPILSRSESMKRRL